MARLASSWEAARSLPGTGRRPTRRDLRSSCPPASRACRQKTPDDASDPGCQVMNGAGQRPAAEANLVWLNPPAQPGDHQIATGSGSTRSSTTPSAFTSFEARDKISRGSISTRPDLVPAPVGGRVQVKAPYGMGTLIACALAHVVPPAGAARRSAWRGRRLGRLSLRRGWAVLGQRWHRPRGGPALVIMSARFPFMMIAAVLPDPNDTEAGGAPLSLSLLFNLCCPAWLVLPLLSGVSP